MTYYKFSAIKVEENFDGMITETPVCLEVSEDYLGYLLVEADTDDEESDHS